MLFDLHKYWGLTAIALNALSGSYALVAYKVPRLRGRAVWASVIIAETAMMIQVMLGAILVSSQEGKPPRFHMFYGFVAFITVGLLYSYRYVFRARSQLEMFYGFGGLFIMGLGIRAVLQVGLSG
jgi:hypothetical protein